MPKGVPNKRYTPEFKRMVVETMKKEGIFLLAIWMIASYAVISCG